LRAQIRTDRGPLALFDFGPDIAALRAACLDETGLPAPVQPQWPHLAAAE